jgi:hypothetical protein
LARCVFPLRRCALGQSHRRSCSRVAVCVCVHILNVFASVCTAIIWGGLAAPTRARPQSPGDEQEQEQEKEQEREGGAIEGHRVLVVNRSTVVSLLRVLLQGLRVRVYGCVFRLFIFKVTWPSPLRD